MKKNARKPKLKITLALCALFLLSACSSLGEPRGEENPSAAPSAAKGDSDKLYIYNWGDYIDPALRARFEDETGIRVVYEEFDTNETLYAKLKPGNTSYDLIFPSDYMIEKMKKEDMLEKIDAGAIPNLKNISPRFKNMDFDPDGEYGVVYLWGTVGILYNKDMVSEPVDSWNILWDDKYAGNIYMYDSQRDSFAVALRKLGYSINSTNLDELTAAKEALIAQKPLVQAYLGDPVKDKMIGGEGALAVVFSGDAVFCMQENPALSYAIPKEGSNIWFDAMCIPKGAKNKENAEKFINFMCDPEVAAQNSEYIGFTTANEAALQLLPQELKDNPAYTAESGALDKCEVFSDLGPFIAEYDKAWTEVLASKRN
ncbi:MAG: spermidine/putrescine ABC transporter substrate-binding protein [Clostridiales bacterium]|jgi:spermidine/putrescine transport system substrate-binding protein|nr:spermidine/putrescine ABC transporter substrate-binding protein [Clostridiales bacterium]